MGYTRTPKRNKNNDPIYRTAGVDAAKTVIKHISWHIPHYTPSLENQQFMMDQLLNKDPTELYYMELIVFREDVNTNNNWTFDLGNSGESTPIFVIVGFQARNKIDSQTVDNAIFDRLPISISVDFEVLKNDDTLSNADGDEISLVNFGPVALFSEAKLTTSSGQHLEMVDNLHPICLMY